MNCPWYPPTTYEPAASTGLLLVNPLFATPMFPLTTTLNRIQACNPRCARWQEGLQLAGKIEPDDEPISYGKILDAVDLYDTLWCCRAEPNHAGLWRRFAVWCAREVQHLMTEQKSIEALDVAERHANGEATDSELVAAQAAARAAHKAACAAWVAGPPVAARAAWAALAASRAAAWQAAWEAAWAAWASGAVAQASQDAAFRQLVTTGTLPPWNRGWEGKESPATSRNTPIWGGSADRSTTGGTVVNKTETLGGTGEGQP